MDWICIVKKKKKEGAIKADRPAPRNIKPLYHSHSSVQGFTFFFFFFTWWFVFLFSFVLFILLLSSSV